MQGAFTEAQRDCVRDHVLELASSDRRVIAAALVGSFARGTDDRWSDLDLTFAVPDDVPVGDVLDDWTSQLVDAFDAVHLFDLPSGASIYRVFLFPGWLQVDLSVTPASKFRSGSGFTLLFGRALEPVEPAQARTPSARHLFGLSVHHVLRARICIERGRYWQAEHWIGQAREHLLAIACGRCGLNASEGRGFDDLPADVLDAFGDAFVRSLEREELLRALGGAVRGLLSEAGEAPELAAEVEAQIRAMAAAT